MSAADYPHPSSAAVSARMRRNRSADTQLEVAVRSALHRSGLRFRKGLRVTTATLSVRPDVVFPRARVAVFLDGCFWHGCPNHGTKPRANATYWSQKLARNAARDQRVVDELQGAGWRVLRFWEHEPVERIVADVASAVHSRSQLSIGASPASR